MLVLGTAITSPTASSSEAFSTFAIQYFLDNKKDLHIGSFDLDIMPVIASEYFSPEVISWISGYRSYRRTITDTMGFPVLVSFTTGEIHCYQKTPFIGGLHYRLLRKWAA